MKTKMKCKLSALMIVLITVLGLTAILGGTVSSAEKIVINQINSVIAKENVPRAGKEVLRFIPNVPDGEPYERPWNGAIWHDEYGVAIDSPVEQHYDKGYEFEAGRTYYADYEYTAANGYEFSANPTINLEGPDPSMFTYRIIARSEDNTKIAVRYTFTIPGEFDYPDINKVSMVYFGTNPLSEGTEPKYCELIYNNCTLTREEWNAGTWGSECVWTLDNDEIKRFKAGQTYVHMIELTAKDGYHFSEDLLAQKGRQQYEEYGEVTLSKDRTVATITYTYHIASIEYLDSIRIEPKSGSENFYLIRAGANLSGGLPFTTVYHFADAPYEIQNYYKWFDVQTGKELFRGIDDMTFELGKKYRLEFTIDIKNEYTNTIRFGANTKLTFYNYAPILSDYIEVKTFTANNAYQMRVEITYTIQPKAGEGNSSYNPVICYNYNEFKYAMENEDIRYVALGNINETMPVGDNGLVTAIKVKGIKNLHLLGDATFTAPSNAVTTYAALLHTTQNTTLNISGAGSLTFKAVANNSYNAVIYNQGGSVNISGGTLHGAYNTAVYGKAIWQEYGELRISGGLFTAANALAPLSTSRAATAVNIQGGQAWIQGGTFKMINMINTIDKPYGLEIGKNATVDLSGGTYYGILLPTTTTQLANYMDEDFYTALSNGSKFNPKSTYSGDYTASGKTVRIAWIIDHVDVHINTPTAGVDITENYFNIPSSGCQVTMYYPQWYQNGSLITYGTFEAGARYKVVVQIEVKPGYSAEFAESVTVSLNNRSVNAKLMSSQWLEIEYDFGTCPNIISNVNLTVTAPKEGNKPSYTVGCASDAYSAVGGSNNYTDYRQWYVSNTGADGTWTVMNTFDKFVAGKYYKFVTDIKTKSNYEFALYDDGNRIMPDVSATVNSYSAKVIKAYDQDPASYITVEYIFGMCNDSVVEKITVVDVVTPVAGQRPTYTYNILGTGYKMDTSKNAYTDIYWTNPTEKWYYIKNGIGWYDVTENDWVYEHETFIPGHEYRVTVYLITDTGYEFAHDKWYELQISATVNGNTANFVPGGFDWIYNQKITYSFTCPQKEINTILLYDLDAPKAGKTPDTLVTPAYPEFYTVKSIRWLDEEDGVVNIFEAGRLYTVEIIIESAKVSGGDTSIFANDMTAYIDGTKVEGWSNTVTRNNDNTVTIRYSFRKPAEAPEIEIYAFTTQPTGGTLTAGGSLTVSWTTNFRTERFVTQYFDGTMWILWLEQYAEGNSSSYTFYNPASATSRFRVLAYIGDDLIATSNEFVITWKEEEPTEYTYYYYPGEADGSPDFDFAVAGSEITLADCMFTAPAGKRFKAWAIGNINGEQKKPGQKITINAETYFYAIWEDIPHTCSATKQSGQKATCTVNGWKDYYKCSCGKLYTHPDGTGEITDLAAWKVGEGKIIARGHIDAAEKDHKCDICSASVGTHEAALGKHTCDYCGKTVTECEDKNKDHKCDTCFAAMGDHTDSTDKHTCDYCGKTVSNCFDRNDDGKCDICGKNIGDCVDADKDHLCDKHGEEMGTHEAALGKHTCDYCEKNVTECEDDNRDHKCDTCLADMGSHEEENGKHTCDYCGKTISECLDKNEDNTCDICGMDIGSKDPDTPDTPDIPNTPDTPDSPDIPNTPNTPETPDTPNTPDNSDTDDNPASKPNQEHGGISVGIVIVIVLGIIAVIAVSTFFIRKKK